MNYYPLLAILAIEYMCNCPLVAILLTYNTCMDLRDAFSIVLRIDLRVKVTVHLCCTNRPPYTFPFQQLSC